MRLTPSLCALSDSDRKVLMSGTLIRAVAVISIVPWLLLVATSCSTSSSPPAQTPTTSATARLSAAPAPGAIKPTVVLVHGAWADTSSWDGEYDALTKQGYDVRAIANPLENLTTDAASVATFLQSLTGPIVLVGHSYGGSVITEAAAGNPNVKALVYVDAAAPDVGETNGSLSGVDSALKQKPESELFGKLPISGAPATVSDLYLKKDIFIHNFANDLPVETTTRLWATQRTASTAAFETPATQAAWKTIPSWYFISTGDQIITPTSENAMAARAHSQVTTYNGGSHLTLISHPEAVTAVIQSAINSVH